MSHPQPYESSVPFRPDRMQAVALYCSDGRFGVQVDDLLQQRLLLPRYDRLAVPGGPACLADHFATLREAEVMLSNLRFLVEVHDLQRVVLITHENCAFYTHRLKIPPMQLRTQQHEDMSKAVQRTRELASGMTVEAFFAHIKDDRVVFEAMEI